MAGQKNENETPTPDVNVLIAQALQMLAQNQPTKVIAEGDPEYVARQHAEGWFDDFFGVTVFQNAYEAQARGETEQTRRRASQMPGGTYIKGRVTVTNEANGSVVRFSYPVKGDNLQKNRDYWRSFQDLVDQCWDEAHALKTA